MLVCSVLITFITPFSSQNAKFPDPVILCGITMFFLDIFRPRRVEGSRLFGIPDIILVFDLYWSPRGGIVK